MLNPITAREKKKKKTLQDWFRSVFLSPACVLTSPGSLGKKITMPGNSVSPIFPSCSKCIPEVNAAVSA